MSRSGQKSLSQAAAVLAERLGGAGISDAEDEAREFLCECLGLSRTEFYLKGEEVVAIDLLSGLKNLIERRVKREPLAYITGRKNFNGRDFLCDRRALIPRPETEILVEEALLLLKQKKIQSPRVLEIGVGTGCISVSLALEYPTGEFVGTDLSREALGLAQENALRFMVSNWVKFLKSNVYEEISADFKGHFDMILSNPPYVATTVLTSLEPELSYEPRPALDGGPEGLDVIRRIVDGAPVYLKPGGVLLLEIGYDQGERVKNLLSGRGFRSVEIKKDFGGHDRVAKGEWLGSI